MSRSILSNERECYICKGTQNLEKHHIFFGFNRQKSEKYGAWVYLCKPHHTITKFSVHENYEVNLKLKQECQKRFEELYDHDTFMAVFGRNYL